MADNSPEPTPPASEPDPAAVEEAFWKRFDNEIHKHLNTWFESKVKEIRSQTSTSRTGGRPTVQGWLADIMFGKLDKQ